MNLKFPVVTNLNALAGILLHDRIHVGDESYSDSSFPEEFTLAHRYETN